VAKLDKEELLFLDTLFDCGRGHVSEANLKQRLMVHGFNEERYSAVKRRLLFARYIGSIYGNITLEKRDYRAVSVEA
jgi:hypothetical protein